MKWVKLLFSFFALASIAQATTIYTTYDWGPTTMGDMWIYCYNSDSGCNSSTLTKYCQSKANTLCPNGGLPATTRCFTGTTALGNAYTECACGVDGCMNTNGMGAN